MGISVIVITYNEESNIKDCLESVSFADEIVVVDAGSTDRTVEIAKQYTDKVFIPGWLGYVEAKKLAIEKATAEWILWIDADERVTKELKEEIISALKDPKDIVAFKIPRKSYFLGRWIKHSGWYPDYVTRLFKKGCGKFTEVLVHEHLIIEGKIAKLKSPIEHYTYPSISKYFQKFDNYTTLASDDLKKKGERFSIWNLLIHPIGTFIKMYFQRLGFLDGLEGFILAVFSSLYVFAKYAKLWELNKK